MSPLSRARATQLEALFPRLDLVAVDREVVNAKAILDRGYARAPQSTPRLDPFRADLSELTRILVKLATLVPRPSSEVGLALGEIAAKLLKRADRCRVHPTAPRQLDGTAQGFFMVAGEFARALAWSQSNRLRIEDVYAQDHTSELRASALRTVEPWPGPPAGPTGEWRSALDWIVRDAAAFVVLNDAKNLAELHHSCHQMIGSIRPMLASKRQDTEDEMSRMDSAFEALDILLGASASQLRMSARALRS
jgi:hypothetical protein